MFLRDILSAMNQRLLLVLIPLSFVLHAIEADPRVVFLVSLFAIVPLVEVMGIATERLSTRLGSVIGLSLIHI